MQCDQPPPRQPVAHEARKGEARIAVPVEPPHQLDRHPRLHLTHLYRLSQDGPTSSTHTLNETHLHTYVCSSFLSFQAMRDEGRTTDGRDQLRRVPLVSSLVQAHATIRGRHHRQEHISKRREKPDCIDPGLEDADESLQLSAYREYAKRGPNHPDGRTNQSDPPDPLCTKETKARGPTLADGTAEGQDWAVEGWN